MTPEYIAGFFDGEGCVSTFIHPRRNTRIALSMTQKKPEVLHEIQRFLGYGKVYVDNRGTSHLRILGRQNAKDFIRLIYPRTIVKREELRLGYQLLGLVGSPGKRVSSGDRQRRLKLIEEIRGCKGSDRHTQSVKG